MIVPNAPIGWVPRSVPDVEGVALTLRDVVVCIRSLIMNLVDAGGEDMVIDVCA